MTEKKALVCSWERYLIFAARSARVLALVEVGGCAAFVAVAFPAFFASFFVFFVVLVFISKKRPS